MSKRAGLFVFLVALAALAAVPSAQAARKLRVVATIPDLKSLTEAVGGDLVEVDSLTRGTQNFHEAEVRPSMMLKLRRADAVVENGLGLDAWADVAITGSNNAELMAGGRGRIDISRGIQVLEVPTTRVDRSMGDVHPQGNPHYWLDPDNGRKIAQAVQAKLSALSQADAAYFAQRYADFDKRLAAAQKKWMDALAPYKGLKVVTYHRSWANFADRFGLDVIGYVEPKPGIPPTPSHTLDVIQEMKRQNVKLILVEPYFDLKTPESIGRATGAEVLMLPPSVGGVKEVTDYITLFDYDINTLVAAIKRTGAK
jgi:ABC-type Zn uptake system ZnuABC Zn-binding protein ZnuA